MSNTREKLLKAKCKKKLAVFYITVAFKNVKPHTSVCVYIYICVCASGSPHYSIIPFKRVALPLSLPPKAAATSKTSKPCHFGRFVAPQNFTDYHSFFLSP
ncbi:unnamed protein product [Ceratitis capitata]|uniref:(Mediterranean fruit fly) hypothetical protein n=1 Tax=Ceratitis capitata TaxID=7213 RepID=A0A811VBN1_CERCA|nr:unnamed protein product [Ceratitis capitata]